MMDEVSETESQHSDADPAFAGNADFDPDLDFDEYSDGEIDEDEVDGLKRDLLSDFDPDRLMVKLDQFEKAVRAAAVKGAEKKREEAETGPAGDEPAKAVVGGSEEAAK